MFSEFRVCCYTAPPTTDHIFLAMWSAGSFLSLKSQLITYLPKYIIINRVAGFSLCWNTEGSMSGKDDSILEGDLLVDRYVFGFYLVFIVVFKNLRTTWPLCLSDECLHQNRYHIGFLSLFFYFFLYTLLDFALKNKSLCRKWTTGSQKATFLIRYRPDSLTKFFVMILIYLRQWIYTNI